MSAPQCLLVTRAIDLLAAAGIKALAMPTKRIDRDEYEAMIAELSDREERRDGDIVTITGSHEDHGRTTLRREAGVFTIKAEAIGFVRDAFAPLPEPD